MIKRVVEPGLPNWPPLFVDSGTGDCFVSARISDWCAIERANAVANLLLSVMYLLIAWFIWRTVPPYSDELYRYLVMAGWFLPFALILFPIVRIRLPVLLSRTIFARRLNLIFTPDLVGLQCHFYRRSLKLRRMIANKTVTVQFLLTEDNDAAAVLQTPFKPNEKPTPRMHLHDARMVEMVIRSNHQPMAGQPIHLAGRFRSIPIARVGKKRGEWLVVVLNAAFDMTAQRRPSNSTRGQDLDRPAIMES